MFRRRLNHISIRLRLAVWYAVALLLALALFGSVIWWSVERRSMAGVDARLNERLAGLQTTLGSEYWIKNRVHLRRELDEFANGYPDGSLIQLRDSAGGLLAPDQGKPRILAADLTPAGPRTVQYQGKPYRIVTGALQSAGERWTVLVASSLDDVLALMRDLRRLLLLVIPAVVVVACLGGYWLSLRALRPVDEITAVAKSIGLHNLAQRVSVPPTGDELQRMSEAWNDVLARLESAVKRMRQFTADASHELRTPLALIRASAELALRREREPEAYRTTLRNIEEHADYMTTLTESLLTLARMDSGDIELSVGPLDLNALVHSVVQQNGALAASRQIGLKADTSTGIAPVKANDRAMRRLLLILLDNALKFTPQGGEVCVSVNPARGGAVVSVSDTGVGIAPDALPFIFDRFYRADPARENGAGFGLGLSIAQAIAHAHGSTIVANSTPQSGSRFSLELHFSEPRA